MYICVNICVYIYLHMELDHVGVGSPTLQSHFSNSGSHQCWNVHAVAALLMHSIGIYSGFRPRETKCLLYV